MSEYLTSFTLKQMPASLIIECKLCTAKTTKNVIDEVRKIPMQTVYTLIYISFKNWPPDLFLIKSTSLHHNPNP